MIANVILVYTVLVGFLVFFLWDRRVAGGVMAGGAIAALNFMWIAAIVRGLIEETSAPRNFAIKLAFKELALFGAVGALVALRVVDPVGLLIGLTGLVAGVVAAVFRPPAGE